jgi:hypothetical protein
MRLLSRARARVEVGVAQDIDVGQPDEMRRHAKVDSCRLSHITYSPKESPGLL